MAAGKGSQPYALRLIEASLLIAILSFFLAYFWSQNGIPGGGQAIPGPLQEQLGDLGWSSTFDNGKGVTLYRYMWPAKGHARARVVLVHGHGTYTCYEFLKSIGQKQRVYYGSWVERMNELGISVAGIDLQGFGRSNSSRGLTSYVERFRDHVEDVGALAKLLDHEQPKGFEQEAPLFVLGMSMGGQVAIRAAHEGMLGSNGRGAILLAPMLSLNRAKQIGLNKYLNRFGRIVSEYLPTLKAVVSPTTKLTKEQLDELGADPLTTKELVRARVAFEYLEACEQFMETEADGVRVPFIIYHSSNDPVIEFEGSEQLVARAPSSDKRLVNASNISPNMTHLLPHEPGNESIRDSIIEWIFARVE